MRRLLLSVLVIFTVTLFPQLPQWSLMVQVNPTPTSFYSVWQKNPTTSTVSVTFLGPGGGRCIVKYILKNGTGKEIARFASPAQDFAAPGTRLFFPTDVFQWNATYDNQTLQKILRSNRFPEGNYTVSVSLTNEAGSTVYATENASFTIIYPTPPALIAPLNESSENRLKPMFTWTPVNVPSEITYKYQFKLVALANGQSVNIAINNNIPVYANEDLTSNVLFYPDDGLALENGRTYAWKVKIVDDQGNPLTANEGNSEIWTFTYYSGAGAGSAALPFTIVELERGVAWFTDFSQVQINSSDNNYTLTGRTTLNLKLADGQVREFPATLQSLTFRKNQYNPFSFVSGSLSSALPAGALPASLTTEQFKGSQVEFNSDTRLILRGNAEIPLKNRTLKIPGIMKIINGRLSGVIEYRTTGENISPLPPKDRYAKPSAQYAGLGDRLEPGFRNFEVQTGGPSNNGFQSFPPEAPIYTFGNSSVRIEITEFKLELPRSVASFAGEVKIFNSHIIATVRDAQLDDDGFLTGTITSNSQYDIDFLQPGGGKYFLRIQGADGYFKFDPENETSEISLTLREPKVMFNVTGLFSQPLTGTASFNGKLTHSSDNPGSSGFKVSELQQFTWQGTPIGNNPIKFNASTWMDITSLTLDSLSNTNRGLDFSIRLNGNYRFPVLNNLLSETIEEIIYTKDGIQLPELTNGQLKQGAYGSITVNPDIAGVNTAKLFSNGINLEIAGLTMSALRLRNTASAGLDLKLGFTVKPSFPQGTTGELNNFIQTFQVSGSSYGFVLSIPARDFSSAEIPLALNASFAIKRFSGEINFVNGSNGIEINPVFRLRGQLKLSQGLPGCGNAQSIDLGQNELTMNGWGNISGTLTNFIPQCDLRIGIWKLKAKQTQLRFAFDNEGQKLNFAGTAGLDISGLTGKATEVNVNLDVNLINGEILSLDGSLSADTLRLPKDNPVFNIAIKNLVVNKSGMKLNGRTEVRFVNGTKLGATFDSLKYSFDEEGITGGRVVFDNGMGLRVNLDAGDNNPVVDFVKKDTVITTANGLQIALPQTVVLTKEGIEISGTGNSRLRYKNFEFTLDAGFGNFKCNYSPFSISAGEIAFSLDNRNYAWLKSNGFEISLSSLIAAILPERLPLKDANIAYLAIRNGDVLYVDAKRLGGDTLQISSKPGQSVKAVFPGLALQSEVIPETDISFSIKVHKSTYALLGGSLEAQVPDFKLEQFDLSKKDQSESGSLNLPLKIKSFQYKLLSGAVKFTFGAVLTAFGENLKEETVTLEVDDEGYLKANLAASQITKKFRPLSGEDADRVIFYLYNVSGAFNTNIKNFVTPDYQLKFEGIVQVGDTSNRYSDIYVDFHLTKNGLYIANIQVDYNSLKVFDLRQVKLEIKSIWPDTLEYSRSEGWKFSISMDAAPKLALASGDVPLRWIRNIVINNQGMNFPRVIQNDLQSYGVGRTTISGLDFQFRNVRMEEYLLSPITPGSIDYESWGIELDLKAALPQNVLGNTYTPGESVIADSVGFADGKLTGEFKYLSQGASFIALGNTYLQFFDMAGTIDGPEINFSLNGIYRLPRSLQKTNRPQYIKIDSLSLNAKGQLSGGVSEVTGSNARIRLLAQSASITGLNVVFDTSSAGEQTVTGEIAADVEVRIPGGTIINSSGDFTVDFLTGALDEESEIVLGDSFELTLPDTTRPFLVVAVDSAVINNSGLIVNGTAELKLKGSTEGVEVEFEDFTVRPYDFGYIEGSMTVKEEFGLSVKSLPNEPLQFSAVDPDYTPTAVNEVNITIPADFTIDSTYFSFEDEADLKFRYSNKAYEDVSTAKFENPVLRFSDFRVTKGKISFMKEEERVGYIDGSGFNVNLLSLVPLPEELMLGSRKTAYLVVRKDEETFVRIDDAGDKLRLTTDAGKKVKLYIPALAKDTTKIPSYDVTFNITVTKSNFEIVEGGITVAGTKAQPLFSLSDFGVPLSVVKLGYQKEQGVYKFTAEASIKLPPAIATDTLNVVLKIDENGKIQVKGAFGTIRATHNPNAVYFKEFKAGSYADFKFDGLQLDLGGEQTVFKLSGDIYSKFFKDSKSATAKPVPLHFTATYSNNEYRFGITPARELKVFKLGFKPLPGKQSSEMLTLTIPENAEDFKLGFDGQIKVDTSITKNMTFTVNGLKVSKNNVELSNVSLPVSQEFDLFGAKLRLHNEQGQPGLALGFANDVFSITASGTLIMMKKEVKFAGLKITSEGDISINNIAPNPAVQIIPNAMWLTSLSVGRKPNTPPDAPIFLTVRGNVKLPKPAAQTNQQFELKIGTDGTVEGGAKVVVFDYPWTAAAVQGRMEQNIWKGKFVVPYAAINVSLGENSSASLEAGLKLFLDPKTNKSVSLGDERQPNTPVPASYKPGIKVATDGSVQFGALSTSGLSDFEVGALKFSELTYKTESNNGTYGLIISGKAGLKLTSVSGSLTFKDLKLTTDPSFSAPKIEGGNLTVKNAVNITVNKVDIQDEGVIEVERVTITKDANGNTTRTKRKVGVEVSSYVTFGGTVTVKNFGGGGMEQFLAYTTTDGGTYIYIKNAKLEIKKVVKITANISYEQDSRGFKLFVSGNGEIDAKPNKIGIAVVGKLAVDVNENVSAGVFVAATAGLNIRLGPVVVLTGLGGGFFYRPEAEDLAEVKKAAEIKSPGSITKMNNAGSAANPAFAVLIYTRMSLGAAGVLDCKNLLTITDESINLSGDAVLLGRNNQIYGTYEITVKFTEVFIEGNLDVKVDIGSIITGSAKIQCWVYGSDNWGILGEVTYKLVPSGASGSGNLYCGNKGFAVKFSMQQGFDFWVVSVRGGITVAAWYLPQENAWGAYFNVWIKAKVLGGLAAFDGDMKGILIGSPEFLLAGTASGSVRVLFASWSGSVWAKFKKSGISGGFGRDSEIEGQIAYAEKLSKNMAELARQAKAELKAAQFRSLFATPEQLKNVQEKLQQYALNARVYPTDPNASTEINKALFMVRDTLTEVMNSQRIWGKYQPSIDAWNKISSRINGSDVVQFANETKIQLTLMEQYSNEYKTVLDQVDNSFSSFEQNVNKEMVKIQAIAANPTQDPMTASFNAPVRKEVPGPNEGPQMQVNNSIVLANERDWSNQSAQVEAFQTSIDRNMATIVSIMDAFDNSFSTGTGFYNLTSKYMQLRTQVDNAYVKFAEYRLEDYKKTFDISHFSNLSGLRSALADWKITKTLPENEIGFRKLSFALWYMHKFLTGEQTTINPATTGNTAWETFYKNVWMSPGLKPSVGYTGVDEKAKLLDGYIRDYMVATPQAVYTALETDLAARIFPLQAERVQKITAIDEFQSKYATRMDNLFDKRKEMLETYLKVVDAYIYMKKNTEEPPNPTYTVASLNQIRTGIVARSVPATLNIGTVQVSNNHYYSNVTFTWSATRNGAAAEILDYQIKIGSQGSPWVSIGKATSFIEKIIPAGAGVHSFEWPYALRARVKEGYMTEQTIRPQVPAGFSKQSLNLPVTQQQINPATISAVERAEIGHPVFENTNLIPDGASFPAYLEFKRRLFNLPYVWRGGEVLYGSLYYVTRPTQIQVSVSTPNRNAISKMQYTLYKIKQDEVITELANSYIRTSDAELAEKLRSKGRVIWDTQLGQILNYSILLSNLTSLNQVRKNGNFDGYDSIYVLAVTPFASNNIAGRMQVRPFYYDNQEPAAPVFRAIPQGYDDPMRDGIVNGEVLFARKDAEISEMWHSESAKHWENNSTFKAPGNRRIGYSVIFDQPKAGGVPLERIELKVFDKNNNRVNVWINGSFSDGPLYVNKSSFGKWYSSDFQRSSYPNFYRYIITFTVPLDYADGGLQVEAAWVNENNQKISATSKTNGVYQSTSKKFNSVIGYTRTARGPISGYSGVNSPGDIYLYDRGVDYLPVKEMILINWDDDTKKKVIAVPPDGVLRLTRTMWEGLAVDYGTYYLLKLRTVYYGNKTSGVHFVSIPKTP